jgi:Tfp pilus assembly protein PilF
VTAVLMLTLISLAANAKAETRKETAASYIQLGDKFAHNKDFDRAIGAYNIALQFYPDSAFAFLRRGCAFEERGDVAKAFSDYTSAVDLMPTLTTAWYNRGNLRLTGGDFDGALADFDKAVESDPTYALAYNNRGIARVALVRLQQGLKSQAEDDFARSLAVKPSLKSFIETRSSQISLK